MLFSVITHLAAYKDKRGVAYLFIRVSVHLKPGSLLTSKAINYVHQLVSNCLLSGDGQVEWLYQSFFQQKQLPAVAGDKINDSGEQKKSSGL